MPKKVKVSPAKIAYDICEEILKMDTYWYEVTLAEESLVEGVSDTLYISCKN